MWYFIYYCLSPCLRSKKSYFCRRQPNKLKRLLWLGNRAAFAISLWKGYAIATPEERQAHYRKHRFRFQAEDVKEVPVHIKSLLLLYEVGLLLSLLRLITLTSAAFMLVNAV